MPANPYEPPKEISRRSGRWRFPAKLNPDATPASMVLWAIAWALMGVGFYTFMVFVRGLPTHYWPFAVALALVAGAFIGALVQWQIDE